MRHPAQDYKRHGTTTLFAAMNTLDGTVISRCEQPHRHIEWLEFLRQINRETPPYKTLHLILATTTRPTSHARLRDRSEIANAHAAATKRGSRAARPGPTGGAHPIILGGGLKAYVCIEPQAMRKSIDGLSQLAAAAVR